METSSETYLTVREHADALAQEAHPRAWRKHRNEPLDQLFRAIWLDQFEDETTHCLLFNPNEEKAYKRGVRRRPEQCAIRVLLWRGLPKGEFWVPSAVRAAREGEYLWQEMAALSWDDYDDQWRRRIIEPVVVLGSVFPQWKEQHWAGTRGLGGRTKGSGSLASHDAPLLDEMKTLMTGLNPMSKWAAAVTIAPRAAGGAHAPPAACHG